MAIVGSLVVLIAGNNAPLAASLASSQAQLKTFSATAGSAFVPIGGAAIVAGAAAAVGMGLAIKAAASFQEQMATVNTIARLTPEALADIGGEVRTLSTVTGIGLPDLTQGLYDLLSVGVPVGRAMEFLGNSATLSIGGVSTAGEAVNAITTAINSWSIAGGNANLTMDDSAKVMDIFAKTVEIGGLTAAEIPGALANVASSAAALNVPLEEVGAAWAILTTRGFTASEAATSMDAALTALQKRPPGMEKLEKATGKSYEAIARTEGAQAAMQQLVDDAQEFGIQLVDVFGRKEALGYARNITDAGAPAFKAALDAMLDSSGTAVEQAAERMGTFSRQMDILGTSINNLGITVGTGLLPAVTELVNHLNDIVAAVTTWADENPALASSILPIIAAIGAIGVAALLLGPVFGIAAAAITLALNPVVVIIAGILASIASIQAFADKNNKILAENPTFTPQQIAEEKWNTGDAAYREAARKHGYSPESNFGGMPWGSFNTPGFHAGEVGSPFAGPPTPIQININQPVVIDGQKIGEINDRRLYNNASQASSGFNRGALEY